MKKLLITTAGIATLLLTTGCRQYFEPDSKMLSKSVYVTKNLDSSIQDFNRNVATLNNGKVLPINIKLPKGFIAIDNQLAKKGNILLVAGDKQIKFNTLIVTAKKRDNLIAILFNDNHFELYDLNQNKTISQAKFGEFLGIRKFIAQPYFYHDLLFIPSLDGKLNVFDMNRKKVIKNFVISQKDYFSNIIYLNVKNDNLIVASRDRLLIIEPNLVLNKDYNIKHILVTDNNIYVFTVEGSVIKLNYSLKELAKKNFRYANIIEPAIVGNYIYFVEHGDGSYLIRLNKNLENVVIYPLHSPSLEDENTFVKDGILYIGDKYINLKDLK